MKTIFYYYTPFGIFTKNQMKHELDKINLDDMDKTFAGKFATVCLLSDGGKTARGISLMSKNDRFYLSEGENQSFQKADRALKGRKIPPYGNNAVLRIIMNTRLPFNKPAELNPVLTMFERKLLKMDVSLETLNRDINIIPRLTGTRLPYKEPYFIHNSGFDSLNKPQQRPEW